LHADWHNFYPENGMNNVSDVMAELQRKGSEQTRKTFARHGIPEPMFGVKVVDLKSIAKKIKGQQSLALELFDTGNYDAMYLAGLVADGAQMTKRELESWAKSCGDVLCGSAVPAVAAESQFARELALKWIESKKDATAACGWNTYAGIVATRADAELDLEEIRALLERVVKQIDSAPDKTRYAMNGFVISVGGYVQPLLKVAKQAARSIGTVEVDMGDTACKVPEALVYIEKIESMGRVGKKRKTMKC
jgi:3-methyladenine DNA glycosylase AlkD